MATLLIAEHDGAALSEETRKALTAATQIGGAVDVLVAGQDAAAVAAVAATLAGVRSVLIADSETLADRLAEPMAALILQQSSSYDALVAPATSMGRSVMPRVAALLDVQQISDVIDVLAPDTFKRPIYAGNAIQTVRASGPKLVVTVRGAAFEAAPDGGAALVERIAVDGEAGPSRHVESRLSKSERPELTSARIVISGGRALGSAERFNEVILPVADKLGAAVGASRAAVDAGYAPNDWQVGQTGKVVAPDLYIACGISGAIQHLAGMKDSKVIVAINSDPEAPIFEVADYGLVGDLFAILPELERAL